MKQKHLTWFLLCFVLLSTVACGWSGSAKLESNVTTEVDSEADTLWNDEIQSVFFETPFGASADEIINNFEKHGFSVDEDLTTDNRISFNYSKDMYSFGGMNWEDLDVFLTNGKFSCIKFYTPCKDRQAAIDGFDAIASQLSKKYQLTELEPADSTVYRSAAAYSKEPYTIYLTSYRYESVEKEIFYTAMLTYLCTSFDDEVSDEL